MTNTVAFTGPSPGLAVSAQEHDMRAPVPDSNALGIPIILAPEELQRLEIFSNPLNLRRDVHIFVDFAQNTSIKRSHRTNEIPPAVCGKLSKLINGTREWSSQLRGPENWCEYLSQTALALGVVKFDNAGIYAGYSSQSETYPDNYIAVLSDRWQKYLAMTSLDKERSLLNALMKNKDNEFFEPPSLLNGPLFPTYGTHGSAAAKMNLPLVRGALLKLLLNFKPDVWYHASYLLKCLRQAAPNLFLIRPTARLRPIRDAG